MISNHAPSAARTTLQVGSVNTLIWLLFSIDNYVTPQAGLEPATS